MLSRLRIGPKLLLAPGVVLLLLVLLSSGAYYAMVRQHQSLQAIVGPRAVQMRSATELVAQAQRVHADTYKLLSWLGSSFSRPRIELLIADIHRQHGAIERAFGALAQQTAPGSAERRHVDGAAQAHRLYVRAAREVAELAHADQTIGANAMIKPEAAFSVLVQRMAGLAKLERELSEEASSAAAADFRTTAGLMPFIVLLAVGVSLLITMAVRRALLRDIRAIGAAALGLASGDLTVGERAYGDDEIGETSRALDAGIRNLNGTLRTVLESARSIGSASRDISLGNLSMHSRAVFRSRSLEDTAVSMQRLAQAVGSGQENSLAEVNQAIVRMDEVTRQNCALVEEAAAAARALQMQALALSRTVAAFRLGEPETAPAAAPPAQKESGVSRDLPRERRRHERNHLRLASSRK